jgi:ABC-type polysaccharide/polyol phosphate transport system ATPase subunit
MFGGEQRMKSMFISDSILAEIKNLYLMYAFRTYQDWSLRDRFIQISKNPKSLFKKRGRRFVALKNVSFQIHKGDRIGILGVNGAGKTTLCRCLSGLFSPSLGTVKLHGRVRAIFDLTVGIYPELTGRENAEIIGEFLYPQLGTNLKPAIQEALDFSGLGEFLDAPFKTYSNGMQARLCLPLLSIAAPDILILDEVFDGADMGFKAKVSKRILNLMDQAGAVVFVSHSKDHIMQVCNRVLVMEQGQLIFDGPMAEGLAFYEQRLQLSALTPPPSE